MAKYNQPIESYTDRPILNPNQNFWKLMKKADRNASINLVTTYIYQSLLDFQAKWYPSSRGSNYIYMPNARYLAVGDKITNLTTNAVYLIAEVILPPSNPIPDGKLPGPFECSPLVMLNLQGAVAPVEDNVLALEEKNTVNFQSSYSRIIQNVPCDQWRDTIVYRIKRREPGTVGHHAFEPPVELRPRVREQKPDKDHPGQHIQILGQWFDNIIQFDCWSVLNNRADDLIEWFEDFMFKYTWVWKKNGVNEILYWMRNTDTESSEWRNDLAVRTVSYYFRTEKIVQIKEYDFRQISLYLELGLPYASGVYNPVTQYSVQPSGYLEIQDLSLVGL